MTLHTSALDKSDLRRWMLQRRAMLDERATRSAMICARLTTLDLYRKARAIHCYLPMGAEVNTQLLIHDALEANKRVAVPVVRRDTSELDHSWLELGGLDDLKSGVFGTPQPRIYRPCDPSVCDLVIVPLLAFDQTCQRLGYGKGYYDRLLARLTAPAIGVAFTIQAVALLPTDPYDIALTAVVTEDAVMWQPGSSFAAESIAQ